MSFKLLLWISIGPVDATGILILSDECNLSTSVDLRVLGGLELQGGSNMTGTDLYVNKPHCAAAVRP